MIINTPGVNTGIYPQLVIECEIGMQITVTDGVTVIEKISESETEIINIPNYGEWTITTYVDGLDYVVTVNIDTVKQYIVDACGSVVINYTSLYDEGDECTDLTGGWSMAQHSVHTLLDDGATVTKYDDHMTATGGTTQDRGSALFTNYTIDTTGYSKFVFIGDASSPNTNGRAGLIQTTVRTGYNNAGCVTDTSQYLDYLFVSYNQNVYTFDGVYMVDNVEQSALYMGILMVSCASPGTTVNVQGMYLAKADTWQKLCNLIDVSATTIDELLNYSNTLLSNSNAVLYMVRNCTGDFMFSAITNNTFITALNSSPYKNVVLANKHWSKFLAMVA